MIKENSKTLYSAFKSKDIRFDGHFFVGISSTGIYCRPICRAKLPKPENCTYYPTAAAAEHHGYRPCLLCRPELAPHNGKLSIANNVALLLESNYDNFENISEIAEYLGYTDRHLRRIFKEEYGVSPVQYMQTHRLLLSKNLLTDTSLNILDIALASGFGSLRRFNFLFKKHYRLTPTSFRKQIGKNNTREDTISLSLSYRPPYLWDQLLSFLSERSIPGIEKVVDNKYFRTVIILNTDGKHISGYICVGNNAKKNSLAVTLSSSLLPVLSQVLTKIRHLFDLNSDPYTIYENLSHMNNIAPNLIVLGTRLPGAFDPFELSVRAVLGQQITIKAARTLVTRLTNTYGTLFKTSIEGLTHTFPLPEDILKLKTNIEDCFGVLGITSRRSKTILDLAFAFTKNTIDFSIYTKLEIEIEKMLSISGIGKWTAHYIAMRAMGYTDAFLETDVGIKKALPFYTPKELLEITKECKPWRSYATINLWNSL